jgi:hypothetical protein
MAELGILEKRVETDEEIISRLPPSLREDQTIREYILEVKHAKDYHHICTKMSRHGVTNPNGTPEEILSKSLVDCLRQYGIRESHIRYISRFLTREELEVAMKTPKITPDEYVYIARIRNMDSGELLRYTTEYESRAECTSDIHSITREWTQMERNLKAWDLGIEYNRPPTEKEIEDALVEEILKKGGSHSKKCRAFTVLAHPEWFKKKS